VPYLDAVPASILCIPMVNGGVAVGPQPGVALDY
jgi:hypothetical protein